MKSSISEQTQTDFFASRLKEYKSLIDECIESFAAEFKVDIADQFGDIPEVVAQTFTDYLQRGGKRIRGALTMVTYELFGGRDKQMILDAALAIEMLQAYILIMDDIQDRSETRRGGKTSHIALRDYHKSKSLKDDSLHFGESMAMNAFIIGCHSAINVVAGLDAQPERILKAIKNINSCYITTAHGQTMDIYNEVADKVLEQDVDNVLVWKTAYYTFVNPMQFGAILAGADEGDLKKIYDYGIPAGRAFQITDDILGIFGEEFDSGKSPLDDIKEGKRTVLTIKALELAPNEQSEFLGNCLGKHDLSQDEFELCRKIIIDSGALEFAKESAQNSVDEARRVVHGFPDSWNKECLNFLEGLVSFLIGRRA